MPLSTGQILHNRYRVVKLLGQGGYGAVYRAWDLSLKQPCAVKENLDASPQAQRQFEREATILAGLRHSHLPRVTDYFFLPGQGQYLGMDFIDGYNLAEAVAQNGGPLPESRALQWVEQVCSALIYLHEQSPPIIHRDIKPQNIIITPGGQAILVDFGISKIFDPVLSTTGGARGVTPGFSPPEQYGRARTDPRSDLYALAATLYYLLTAQEPPDAIERLVHHAPLAPPRQHSPAISPAVEQAMLRALETDSQDRFATVKEFRQALEGQEAAPPSVQLQQPAPTPVVSQTWSPPVLETAKAAPMQRPGDVTGVATYSIVTSVAATGLAIAIGELTGLAIMIFVAGLLGLIGGILMLLRKELGRRLGLAFLGLLVFAGVLMGAEFADSIVYYSSPRIGWYFSESSFLLVLVTLLVIWISIYCFSYLLSPLVLDYFQPAAAPHKPDPGKALNLVGWLHIVLGFWLVAPIFIGIGMLARQNKRMWWMAIIALLILCLAALGLAGWVFYDSDYQPIDGILTGLGLLVLTLESHVWLYLRRPEVWQVYP
ncbi:MAG: serine/threonine-protein kinase [Chloroflexota bacterium]